MVRGRQAVCDGDAEDLERRDASDSVDCWRLLDLTPPPCVGEDDFMRLETVERQVDRSRPRLDVVDLGDPRVDVVGWHDEVRLVSSANLHS